MGMIEEMRQCMSVQFGQIYTVWTPFELASHNSGVANSRAWLGGGRREVSLGSWPQGATVSQCQLTD